MRIASIRLRDKVEGPLRKCPNGGFRARSRQGAHHDHGHSRVVLLERTQCIETAHSWHVDVESGYIRLILCSLFKSIAAIARMGYHTRDARRVDAACKDRAKRPGVVHNKHAKLSHHRTPS